MSARFSAIYNDSEIEGMIFAYINQVAAIYRVRLKMRKGLNSYFQLPSLGQEIEIMITQLEIQKEKFPKFDNMEGDR